MIYHGAGCLIPLNSSTSSAGPHYRVDQQAKTMFRYLFEGLKRNVTLCDDPRDLQDGSGVESKELLLLPPRPRPRLPTAIWHGWLR